jgi:two-component system, LytTR family, response regulator
MITCFVLDDEPHAIEVLTHYISQTPYLSLIGTSLDPVEAFPRLNEEAPDLLFTDINMPGISGIELVKTLRSHTKIILCSAHSEFAAEGFELEVVDYLLKPIRFPRFVQAAQRAFNSIGTPNLQQPIPLEEDYIYIKTEQKGKLHKINLVDIEYIEGRRNYVALHYNDHVIMALLNMKDLEERLPSRHFIRIHKSHIVPIRYITGIEGNIIHLKDNSVKFVLGDTYKQAFIEKMQAKLML